MENIWLCHLSKDNNHPELCWKTIENRLFYEGIRVGKDVSLTALTRTRPSLLLRATRLTLFLCHVVLPNGTVRCHNMAGRPFLHLERKMLCVAQFAIFERGKTNLSIKYTDEKYQDYFDRGSRSSCFQLDFLLFKLRPYDKDLVKVTPRPLELKEAKSMSATATFAPKWFKRKPNSPSHPFCAMPVERCGDRI